MNPELLEKRCDEHRSWIMELQDRSHRQDIQLNTIEGDVKYIKAKLENGLFTNLKTLCDKVEELSPIVKDNQDWVNRFKYGTFYISVILLGSAIVKWLFHL